MKRKYDLEQRLIQFSIDVITLCKESSKSFASEHLIKQIIRSSTSSALNYGEAQSAESTKDFQHKMKICLKELRETLVNLKIQKGINNVQEKEKLTEIMNENNELIAIFVSSIRTSQNKNRIMNRE